jgi:nucleolar protein 56
MVSLELYLTPLAIIYRSSDGWGGSVSIDTPERNYLTHILSGERCPPVEEIAKIISDKGVRKVYTHSPQLITLLSQLLQGVEFERVRLTEPLERLATSLGIVKGSEQYRESVHRIALKIVEDSLRSAVQRRDMMIVQAVNYLDDIQKIINMTASRLMEWFGTHFPELREYVSDPVRYAEIVYEYRDREGISEAAQRGALGSELSRKVWEAAQRSVGVELAEQDKKVIWEVASTVISLAKQRDFLEKYIRTLMDIEAPNLTAITGPVLGARLISLAGGLNNLARLPASTIQVLGAEKALFRFFKTGRGAPKHGVIFQHPYVHGSPKWQRGKIARALATKIALAAKIDYHSREDRSAELRAALEKRVQDIRQKYPSPPVKARQPTVGKRRRGR